MQQIVADLNPLCFCCVVGALWQFAYSFVMPHNCTGSLFALGVWFDMAWLVRVSDETGCWGRCQVRACVSVGLLYVSYHRNLLSVCYLSRGKEVVFTRASVCSFVCLSVC